MRPIYIYFYLNHWGITINYLSPFANFAAHDYRYIIN